MLTKSSIHLSLINHLHSERILPNLFGYLRYSYNYEDYNPIHIILCIPSHDSINISTNFCSVFYILLFSTNTTFSPNKPG